jgi:hypothetical protein
MKSRAIEMNYGVSRLDYDSQAVSFSIANFSLKYQSKTCGGCEGRIDIGLDHPQLTGIPSGYDGVMPAHIFATGKVSGLDFASLIASKEAFANPFKGELLLTPTLASQTSFSIPTFKLSAFNETMDIKANGKLEARNLAAGWVLNGKIEAVIKKDAERIRRLLANSRVDRTTQALRATLRSALAAGSTSADGAMTMTIDIRDNDVTINGKAVDINW